MMTTTTAPNPSESFRIYVASLSDYNAGILHGAWIDFDQLDDIDDLWDAVRAMLKTSPTAKATGLPAEEWAIHDYEGWCGFSLSEYCGLEGLWRAYEELVGLVDDGGYSAEAIQAYAEYGGADITEAAAGTFRADFEDAYVGEYESERDFTEELIDDTGMLADVPDFLRNYFDYEAFARDLFLTDYYMSEEGFVFRAC